MCHDPNWPQGFGEGREEKKARASALERGSQLSSVVCGSRGEGCSVSVVAALGLCLRGGPSVVSLLGLSSLAGEMFPGGLGESSCLVVFEAVRWTRGLQRTLGR